MKKRKCDYFVYSFFSSELQDYPYRPFIAKNHAQAINKFVIFLAEKDIVAPALELHCIGECQVDEQGLPIDGSIQPYVIPFKVQKKHNMLADVVVLTDYYSYKLQKYVLQLFNLNRKEQEKCKKKHK